MKRRDYRGLDAVIIRILRDHPEGLTAEEMKAMISPDVDLSGWGSAIRRMSSDGLIMRRTSGRKFNNIWVVK